MVNDPTHGIQGFGEAVAALYEESVTRYETTVELAYTWLRDHWGVTPEAAMAARLGVCADPYPRHRSWQGRLIVPYLRKGKPYQLKARCIQDHQGQSCKDVGHPKYLAEGDMEPSLYNVDALLSDGDLLVIGEGEGDAVVLVYEMHLNAIGYPGAGNWRPHFNRAIGPDWPEIIIVADGDDAGRKAAHKIARQFLGARVVEMPAGEDVASVYASRGEEGLRSVLGLDAAGQ